ncbi:MAG: HAD family hydrolase [Deltaproteobacteria bacterium]|nr:HAD family hydrolase [Deltaproteobacteria bacterium]
MKSIRVITFDCDGVLFDTQKANRMYYDELLARFGLPPMDADQFDYAQMHTVEESLVLLFPDPGLRNAAHEYRKTRGYGPYIRHMEMAPGLKGVLSRLREEHAIAIATNRTDTMPSVLAQHGIEDYFELVVTALDVKRPKPAPDPLLLVVDHFKVGRHEMAYVGDSALDELSAKAAGVCFVAYNNPGLEADFHIRSMAELEDLMAVNPVS